MIGIVGIVVGIVVRIVVVEEDKAAIGSRSIDGVVVVCVIVRTVLLLLQTLSVIVDRVRENFAPGDG